MISFQKFFAWAPEICYGNNGHRDTDSAVSGHGWPDPSHAGVEGRRAGTYSQIVWPQSGNHVNHVDTLVGTY